MGFNMSWIFVDRIELDELYAAFDVKSTGEAAIHMTWEQQSPVGRTEPQSWLVRDLWAVFICSRHNNRYRSTAPVAPAREITGRQLRGS